MKIDIELIDAKKETPKEDGLFVLIFISNVDNRGITKCFVGYYNNNNWYYINDTIAENVSFFSYLPKPKHDKYYNVK